MTKKLTTRSIIVLMAVIMLFLAIAPATVFAAGDNPETLNKTYQQALTRNKQINKWAYADLKAQTDYAQVRISANKRNGRDAAAATVEAALRNYKLDFEAAMAINADAKALLDRREGVGVTGNVDDPLMFKNTIRDANTMMSRSESMIRDAGRKIHAVVKAN